MKLSPRTQYKLRVVVSAAVAFQIGREMAKQVRMVVDLAKWCAEPLKPKPEPFLIGTTHPELSPLRWYHGPTELDPDPGAMWCYDCDYRVYAGDGVYGCSGCGREDAGDVDDQAVTE